MYRSHGLVDRSDSGDYDLKSLSDEAAFLHTRYRCRNSYVSAALGRRAGAIMVAQQAFVLVTTDRVVQEARRRLKWGLKRPELLPLINGLTAAIVVVAVIALEPIIPRCTQALRDAVAGRNGSIRDARMLALAWGIEGDIWTTDRDFAGADVTTCSTPNLMRWFVGAVALA